MRLVKWLSPHLRRALTRGERNLPSGVSKQARTPRDWWEKRSDPGSDLFDPGRKEVLDRWAKKRGGRKTRRLRRR
ncbi:hypothetical protein NPIL_507441 [Nephila pilipes]|uniref:Uncharacterized protein n=1 Tax=Nephila pilipes TaxID=299642 RepID=A0A8X6MGE4_NEPPI|nr:hypothetical protein NPIL_507441 [Nephila pilipes]